MENLNKKRYDNKNIYVYRKYYFELKNKGDKKVLSYNKIVRCNSTFDYLVLDLETKYKTYDGDISLDMIEQDILKINLTNL